MRLGCETGAEKPSLHDADGDGSRFSGSGLHALSVRQDADTNGVADPGEVKSVRSLGITSIALSDRDDLTGSFEMNARPIRRGIGGRMRSDSSRLPPNGPLIDGLS